jgi:hypothetical protein
MVNHEAIFLQQVVKLISEREDHYIEWDDVLDTFDFNDLIEEYPRLERSHNFGDNDYVPNLSKVVKEAFKRNKKNALEMFHFIFVMHLKIDQSDFESIDWLESFLETDKSSIIIPLNDPFLEIENVPDDFYRDLINLINQAYSIEFYPAVLIFSRKILENLLVDILRKKYGMPNIDMFYMTSKGRFQGFNTLLKNFDDNLGDFQHIIPELDSNFVKQINEYRESGNSSAHTLELNITKEDVDKKSNLEFIIKTLIRLFNNI